MRVEADIKKWGNSLALRATGVMADLPKFKVGTRVTVDVSSEGIVVKPAVRKSGLLICCPISTSIRGGATEVPIANLDRPSVVAASLVQTLSWKERKVKTILTARQDEFRETLFRLLPLIGAVEFLES